MRNIQKRYFLAAASAIFFVTAGAHLSCIYFGPACYKLQLAPASIVALAQNNFYLASFYNVVGSSLFIVAGFYAMAPVIKCCKLPYIKIIIYTISCICIVRGLLSLPLYYLATSSNLIVSILVGLVWFLVGCLLLAGNLNVQKNT